MTTDSHLRTGKKREGLAGPCGGISRDGEPNPIRFESFGLQRPSVLQDVLPGSERPGIAPSSMGNGSSVESDLSFVRA